MNGQLDLIEPVTLARSRGHAGAALAAEKAERVVDPEWTDKAVDAIREFARNHGDLLWTMEMCRGVIELQKLVPEPTDRRAWGAATLVAVRRGYIERTRTYHPAVSSHGSDKPCYRKGPKA